MERLVHAELGRGLKGEAGDEGLDGGDESHQQPGANDLRTQLGPPVERLE